MTDNCPHCGTTTRRPTPHHDQPTVRFTCARCGHTWTTNYEPEPYDVLDDSLPRHWADLG